MAAKRNKAGKTWKQHAGPHLSRALKLAAKTWKPKSQRMDKAKVKRLQSQREKINADIRREREKG